MELVGWLFGCLVAWLNWLFSFLDDLLVGWLVKLVG